MASLSQETLVPFRKTVKVLNIHPMTILVLLGTDKLSIYEIMIKCVGNFATKHSSFEAALLSSASNPFQLEYK